MTIPAKKFIITALFPNSQIESFANYYNIPFDENTDEKIKELTTQYLINFLSEPFIRDLRVNTNKKLKDLVKVQEKQLKETEKQEANIILENSKNALSIDVEDTVIELPKEEVMDENFNIGDDKNV